MPNQEIRMITTALLVNTIEMVNKLRGVRSFCESVFSVFLDILDILCRRNIDSRLAQSA